MPTLTLVDYPTKTDKSCTFTNPLESRWDNALKNFPNNPKNILRNKQNQI